MHGQRSCKRSSAAPSSAADLRFASYMYEHPRTLLTGGADDHEGQCAECEDETGARSPIADALVCYHAAKQNDDAEGASAAALSFMIALTGHLSSASAGPCDGVDPAEAAIVARLVGELRAAGDLTASYVAEVDGRIAAHVALSHLRSPARALALAPLAVRPAMQRRKLGSALVRAALADAAAQNARTVLVVGNPAYYGRFGFDGAAAAGFSSPLAGPFLMAVKLGHPRNVEAEDGGPIVYAPAFDRLV